MKKLTIIFFLMPLMLQAQISNKSSDLNDQGIKFEQGLNWQQLISKAKAENKYIFLDCYTTWCAPCKKMEKEVYTTQAVGSLYNDKFICVKLQMDSIANEDETIKATYPD